MTRADSALALAVGRSHLTGEERGRDRGIPLAGSSTVNRAGRTLSISHIFF